MLTEEEYVKSFLRDTLILIKLFGDQLNSIERLTVETPDKRKSLEAYLKDMSDSLHDKIAHSLTIFLDDLRKLINNCTFSLVTELIQDMPQSSRMDFLKGYIEDERRMKSLRIQLLQMTDSYSPSLDTDTIRSHLAQFMRDIDFGIDQGSLKGAEGGYQIQPITENSLEGCDSFEYDTGIDSFLLKGKRDLQVGKDGPGNEERSFIAPEVKGKSNHCQNFKEDYQPSEYYTPLKTNDTNNFTLNNNEDESMRVNLDILKNLEMAIEPVSRKSYSFVSKIVLSSGKDQTSDNSIYIEGIKPEEVSYMESNYSQNDTQYNQNYYHIASKKDSCISDKSIVDVVRNRSHNSENLIILENLPKCKKSC